MARDYNTAVRIAITHLKDSFGRNFSRCWMGFLMEFKGIVKLVQAATIVHRQNPESSNLDINFGEVLNVIPKQQVAEFINNLLKNPLGDSKTTKDVIIVSESDIVPLLEFMARVNAGKHYGIDGGQESHKRLYHFFAGAHLKKQDLGRLLLDDPILEDARPRHLPEVVACLEAQ